MARVTRMATKIIFRIQYLSPRREIPDDDNDDDNDDDTSDPIGVKRRFFADESFVFFL